MAVNDPLDWAALEREHRDSLAAILNANQDLAERIQRLGVTADYDPSDDVLYISIGPSTAAVAESIDNTIFLRVEPDTLKLASIEVWGVRSAAPTDSKVVALLLDLVHRAGAPAPERLAADIRELIAV
jgi:uncharacterized protein YuzE